MTTPIRPGARLLATAAWPVLRRRSGEPDLAAACAAHGPDPVLERRRVRPEPGAAVPLASRLGADRRHQDRRSRRPPRTPTATRASKAATFTYDANGANPIGYGAGATCGVNGLACFTRDAPTGFTMWLREQGHVFDWGTLKWCQAYATPPNGCYDAETIALDEFGHVEGLDHHVNYADDSDYEDAVVQTYSRTKPSAGWNTHVFGRCDVATLQMQYDVRPGRPKYSTCLDLSTVLTLTASSTSAIAVGGTTTLTATLKVVDFDAVRAAARQPDLRPDRDAPAPRSRARPRGSAVGTMAIGSASGTYVLAQRPGGANRIPGGLPAPGDRGPQWRHLGHRADLCRAAARGRRRRL